MRHVTVKTCLLVISMVVTAILFSQELYLHSTRNFKVLLLNRKSLQRQFVVFKNMSSLQQTNNSIIAPPQSVANKTILVYRLKRVKDIAFNIFIFSAVVGNTSRNSTFDRVVFSAWVNKKYSNYTNFKCCLRYQSRRLVTTKLLKKIDWSYMKLTTLQAKQYVCPNPRGVQGDRLVGTTIVFNQTECPLANIWYEKPSYAYRNENDIAVCTKVAYGSLPADDLISWFEIHRSMGVNKVVTYTNDLNPAAQAVLNYYSSIGLVETYPFVVPKYGNGRQAVASIGVKNCQAWNDEQISVYDCLEKLRGYKYLAVIDFDEYIIPQNGENWTTLFDKLWRQRPWAAGFLFLVQLHITSWGVTNNNGTFITQRYQNRTKPMMDRIKNVVMPERLQLGGLSTHDFWPDYSKNYKRSQCPSATATIHHYRSCRKNWDGKRNRTSCFDLQRFLDPIVANTMRKVEERALEIRRNLLFSNDNTSI